MLLNPNCISMCAYASCCVQYNAGVVGDLLRKALADVDEPLVISALAAAPGPPPHDLCSVEALGEARVLHTSALH